MHQKNTQPPPQDPPNWDFKHVIYEGGIHIWEFCLIFQKGNFNKITIIRISKIWIYILLSYANIPVSSQLVNTVTILKQIYL